MPKACLKLVLNLFQYSNALMLYCIFFNRHALYSVTFVRLKNSVKRFVPICIETRSDRSHVSKLKLNCDYSEIEKNRAYCSVDSSVLLRLNSIKGFNWKWYTCWIAIGQFVMFIYKYISEKTYIQKKLSRI